MLTDPFYQDKPAYSGNSTGVQYVPSIVGVDWLPLLTEIKHLLETAGWTLVDAEPSKAKAETLYSFMPIAVAPVPPRTPVPLTCTSFFLNRQIQMTIAGVDYIAYNPYLNSAAGGGGCENREYYPMGGTISDTASNLAAAVSGRSPYFAEYTGDRTDPGLPPIAWRNLYDFTSKAPAYENDFYDLSVLGSHFSSGGYYTMRSPPMDDSGDFINIRLQQYAINGIFGIQDNAQSGLRTPFLTVQPRHGGSYSQAIYASGDYYMHANKYQFAIWPGDDRTGRGGSAMVAGLLKVDKGHEAGETPVIVYGSESYSQLGFVTNFQQVVNQMHWDYSLATGFGTTLTDVGWRTQEPSTVYWRNPTLFHHGLRGLALKTLFSQPLVQSAYVLLTNDPNVQEEVQIAGRLWDMLVVSDTALSTGLEDKQGAIYDNVHWQRLAIATISGDLKSSLWVKIEAN